MNKYWRSEKTRVILSICTGKQFNGQVARSAQFDMVA